MKPLQRYYFLIILMAVVFSACFGPEAKENVLASALATEDVAAATTSLLLQSTDGGLTWQDISEGLPEHEQPEGFFAGASDLYVHIKNVMYHSKSNLKTPFWEKENVPDLKNRSSRGQSTSIAFNRSGVMAYNDDGQIYQKTSAADPDSNRDWLPIHTNFKKHALRSVFETSDGTIFLSYDHGFYKSADKGKSWKQLQKSPVFNIVESAGVLIAPGGRSGIIRSTDNGEHWEWVVSEGRVSFGIERIDGGLVALAYGNVTNSRRIRISLDNGETWKDIKGEGLPSSSISSIKQMGKYLICGHPDGIFRSSDMGKTWTRVHAAVEEDAKKFIEASNSTQRVNVSKKVFTIYTSGNTLYAVARIPGC